MKTQKIINAICIALMLGWVLSQYWSMVQERKIKVARGLVRQEIVCDGMQITVYDLPHAYHPDELCSTIFDE